MTIVFDNTDDGPHELQIPALDVSTGIVQGGQTARVVFTPEKVGTFAYDQPQGACVSQVRPSVQLHRRAGDQRQRDRARPLIESPSLE